MAGVRSPLPLPGFARDWVGGDIRGLSSLAGQCYRIVPQVTGADSALTGQVSELTSDGGWKGAAASAFTSAWDKDSVAAGQLAKAWNAIGGVVDELAAELAGLENALETAAREAEAYGVAIDQSTGTVAPEIAALGQAGTAAQAAASRARLSAEYTSFRQQTLDRAAAARATAAGELQTLTEAMLPSSTSRDWGQGVDVLDGLRAVWSIPTVYRQELEKDLPELEQNVENTQRAAWEELIEARKLMGNAARLSQDTGDMATAALKEEAAVQSKIGTALELESAGSKLAAGEADGVAGLAGLDGLAGLARGLVRGVPLAGTTVAAGLTIYQDHHQGESWDRSVADGVVSSGAALGTGIAVAAAIGGGSLLAVGGGVVLGGVFAVGVGDFVHNMFQENWQGDWHKDGVLDGTVHGVADSYDKTRHDLAHMWNDINPF